MIYYTLTQKYNTLTNPYQTSDLVDPLCKNQSFDTVRKTWSAKRLFPFDRRIFVTPDPVTLVFMPK